jgi:nitrogen fixation/metabolism regulation signal transduction histidine kinase
MGISSSAAAGIAGTVLMGIVLVKFFLRPIKNLINASRKMTAGDFKKQVSVHSQDER